MSFTPLRSDRPGRRDLRLVISARALSMLGDQIAVVALVLRAQSNGGGARAVVELLLAGVLPLMLLAPAAGQLVDRTDSRTLLLVSSLAQLACCMMLVFRTDRVSTLLLVAALAAGQSVNAATWQALIPHIVGTDRLAAAIGLSQAANTTATIIAPVLAGVLTAWYGARIPLLLDAATFAAVTGAALLVRSRRGGRVEEQPDTRGGWAILRSDRTLSLLLLMLVAFVLLSSMVNVVEVFLIRQTMHASATWYGMVGGMWGVGLFGGAMLGRRLPGQRPLLRVALGSCALLGLALVGMGVAPNPPWMLPASLCGGIANGLLNLSTSALVGIRTAEQVRGRVSAIVNGLTSAGQVGALLLGGLLAALLAPRTIFVVAGLLGVLTPLALCRWLLASAVPAPLPS